MNQLIPILLYHSISSEATSAFRRWAVPPERFAAHMQYLASNGYTALTVSQLVDRLSAPTLALPERPVLITFDDGLACFYHEALPTLDRFGLVATLYVVTAYIGGHSRWLATWQQLSEIAASGCEIGAHTHTHPELDTLRPAQVAEELQNSRATLELNLGIPVRTCAYPHGYHDSTVIRVTRESGFTSACAVRHAMSSTADDRYALSRIIVENSTSVAELARLVEGHGLRVAPFPETLGTKVWRVIRRLRSRTTRLAAPQLVQRSSS
jgi:peptidoglycan/xylan/chitin deacetylase (PgdA/CDA1 family)